MPSVYGVHVETEMIFCTVQRWRNTYISGNEVPYEWAINVLYCRHPWLPKRGPGTSFVLYDPMYVHVLYCSTRCYNINLLYFSNIVSLTQARFITSCIKWTGKWKMEIANFHFPCEIPFQDFWVNGIVVHYQCLLPMQIQWLCGRWRPAWTRPITLIFESPVPMDDKTYAMRPLVHFKTSRNKINKNKTKDVEALQITFASRC